MTSRAPASEPPRPPASGRPRPLASGPSLRRRLSVSFAAITVLGALVIGLVLLPILASHYATAERTYLEGAAERAVRDLSTVSWKDRPLLEAAAQQLAVLAQARVRIIDAGGAVLADVRAPAAVEPPPAAQPLPNPLGVSLLGDSPSPASLPRSGQTVSRPVNKPDKVGGTLLGTVELSEAPAYEQVALLNVAVAWGLASLLGVLVAAIAGALLSARITRPLVLLTGATDRMAGGDLSVRAAVEGNDELGRLGASFNAMAARVEETVSSLRRFVADAAHEIGTPLTALQADLDLAEAHAKTPDERRLLARATTQAERLAGLTADLLRLSRLEGGEGSAATERLDLGALLAQVVDAFASRAAQAGLDLQAELPPGRITVLANAERLRTLAGYLVDNAIKFTPAGGRVTVGLASAGDSARVWVADTGIGIPADELPNLFERFRRGRAARTYPGSGLGLAIVRATAELYGGRVTAASGAGGSRFEVILALA